MLGKNKKLIIAKSLVSRLFLCHKKPSLTFNSFFSEQKVRKCSIKRTKSWGM
jgi:hypothetical protein